MELTKKEKLSVEIPDDLKDVFDISKNMEGVIPRLPQIKIIHRGQLFEMSDGEKVEKFSAVILDQHLANAWWEGDISESGGNQIPNCFSLDGLHPVEDCTNRQNDNCAECNQNQYGSDNKGKGKACKNMKRLHLLFEDSSLPRRLTVPPTSLKSFDTYMTELVDRGLPYMAVMSEFSLNKKISDSFEYSEVKISKLKVLEKDELYVIAEYIKKYKESARQQEIRQDEYVDNNQTQDNPQSEDNDIPF